MASGFVLALGFAEFIASCIVSGTSGGNYIGGVYCGILCMAAGIAGFRSQTRNQINWILGLSIAAIITSVIACAVQAAYYNFFSDLEACSNYDSGEANTWVFLHCSFLFFLFFFLLWLSLFIIILSCGLAAPGFQCYGDSDAYPNAEYCAANWQVRFFSHFIVSVDFFGVGNLQACLFRLLIHVGRSLLLLLLFCCCSAALLLLFQHFLSSVPVFCSLWVLSPFAGEQRRRCGHVFLRDHHRLVYNLLRFH